MLQTTDQDSTKRIHPLDPPIAAEIGHATTLVKKVLSSVPTFFTVCVQEPAKNHLSNHTELDSCMRTLKIVGTDYPGPDKLDGGFEALVDLTNDSVSLTRIQEGQIPIGFTDVVRVIGIVKADPKWLATMARRGITGIENVQIDPWPAGGYQHPSIPQGHRAHRAISFVREDKTDNGYARPVPGLIAHVDLTLGKVVHLEDRGEVPLPPESGRYDLASQTTVREALKPLDISQSQGPSFDVEGNSIKWANWEFRVSVHPINGLVLHQVGYRDRDELRPILHRASLSDMVVPYGDTDPMHVWKHMLDAGEASIGNCVNSLELGCDCLGEIHYLDHVTVKPVGSPRVVKNAICIHEEDYGVLWKHTDGLSQTTEVRRSRRLVVSTFHTVGNYEYGFYWYLYLDGTIQMEVKLTVIVGVSAINEGEERPEFAPLIAPNLTSPIHQHLFCFRLDMSINGDENSIYEVNAEPTPMGPENEDGTAFQANVRLLRTESEAKRDVDASTARYWKIVNPKRTNRLSAPVAYKLVPDNVPKLMARRSESQVAKRAGFAQHNLWVTPFEEDSICAAGDYPNLHPGGEGLPAWTSQNRSIEATDLVV